MVNLWGIYRTVGFLLINSANTLRCWDQGEGLFDVTSAKEGRCLCWETPAQGLLGPGDKLG